MYLGVRAVSGEMIVRLRGCVEDSHGSKKARERGWDHVLRMWFSAFLGMVDVAQGESKRQLA